MGKRARKAVRLAAAALIGISMIIGQTGGLAAVYGMESVSGNDVRANDRKEDDKECGAGDESDDGKEGAEAAGSVSRPEGDVSGNVVQASGTEKEETALYEEEAEHGSLSNGARIKECETASGAKLVHYLGSDGGSHEDGAVTFTVPDMEAGSYELRFYYASNSSDRYFDIFINDKQVSGGRQLPSTGSFEVPCETPVTVDVELARGSNTIRFSCAGWYAPNLDRIQIFPSAGADAAEEGYYEAEKGELSGQAVITDCEEASGGRMAGYLGGGDGEDRGYVTMTGIEVPEDGLYDVSVYYATGNSRSFTISVNSGEEVRLVCASSGGFEKIGKASIKLNLKAGENTLRFGCSDGYAPNLDRIYVPKEKSEIGAAADTRLTLQAEEALLYNKASGDYNSSACAGGGKVSNIGGDNKGYAVFTGIEIFQPGTYAIDVAYASKEDREFLITVDEEQEIRMKCRAGYEWDVPNRHIVTCELSAGTHSIAFGNPSGYAPNLDEIRIYPCEVFENQDYTFLYDLQTGRYDVIADGRTKICDAYAAAEVDGELLETIRYSQRTFSRQELRDDFGTGEMWTAVSREDGRPVIEQRFYLYEDAGYFLTQTDIYREDGGLAATNYLAPLYAQGLGTMENELDGKDYFLRVPYDNDGWVKYELSAINGSDTGYEAAAVLSEESGKAVVMGSLSHDKWKTGISFSGMQNQIYELKLYGGANGALTRDQSPHGMVSGDKVTSPLMFIGIYDDWKEGMNAYARANTKVTAPKSNDVGVPFGWNSWGSVQSSINLDTAVGISDYIKDNFQDSWKPGEDDVVYTVLDSYWDNLTDEELKAFVDHCRENGQEPGIYWAPFVSWLSQKDLATHYVEGSEGVPYQDIILKKADGSYYGNDLDGAFPVDITHPAARKRVDCFIDRFKAAGFTYIKLDFLVHGALEGQRYDTSLQTGTQAYNWGMQYVTDRIGGQMFVNLSIAPTFPYQYADGKRIACDAYYSIGNTEYTLNGLTYGFWQKELYQYPDPDHLVVWGRDGRASAEEARSRITSGIMLGTSFLTGDNFIDPAGDKEAAAQRFREVLCNEDILSVARTGKIFEPLSVNHVKSAANAFTMTDGSVSYLAVLNYSGQTVEQEFDLRLLFGVNEQTPVKELWSGSGTDLADGVLHVSLAGKDSKVFRIGTPQDPDDGNGPDDGGGSGGNTPDDGDHTGGDTPDDGDHTGGDTPDDGDHTGGNTPDDGDHTGGNTPDDGDHTGGNTPDDGEHTGGDTPDDGDHTGDNSGGEEQTSGSGNSPAGQTMEKSPATGDWNYMAATLAGLTAMAASAWCIRRYRRVK